MKSRKIEYPRVRLSSSGVILSMWIDTWCQGVKTEPDSCQGFPVTGQEPLGIKWKKKPKISPLNIRKIKKSLCWSNTGRDSPGLQRECRVFGAGNIKNPSGQCPEQPVLFDQALSRVVGLGDLQTCFQTLGFLWFWKVLFNSDDKTKAGQYYRTFSGRWK